MWLWGFAKDSRGRLYDDSASSFAEQRADANGAGFQKEQGRANRPKRNGNRNPRHVHLLTRNNGKNPISGHAAFAANMTPSLNLNCSTRQATQRNPEARTNTHNLGRVADGLSTPSLHQEDGPAKRQVCIGALSDLSSHLINIGATFAAVAEPSDLSSLEPSSPLRIARLSPFPLELIIIIAVVVVVITAAAVTMGSTLSRCTSKNSGHSRAPSSLSIPDSGQKFLDRQPNWLVTPARWRSKTASQQPLRYRTPTPYPKNDRKPMADSTETVDGLIREKTSTFAAPPMSHLDMPNSRCRQDLGESCNPRIQKQQPALRITFEVSPRLNRFERIV
ncbi:hypothetical protein VTH06DRAFT_5343 [Thermothelomyces fergusii]